MAHAVEQLAEEEIEVAQEGVHSAYVGERNAEVAPILARPGVERENLRIAQARTDGLAGLKVFVRHRSQRRQAVLQREIDIARADELGADALLERNDHFVLPAAREPPPRPVVG